MQATESVHEAYMSLVGPTPARPQNRAHFFAIAAHSMRQVLLDHARRRGAGKRGGPHAIRVDVEDRFLIHDDSLDEVLAIDEALKILAVIDPVQSQLIELRFFAGLSIDVAVEVMGVSESTVKREWRLAKAWLNH